MSRTGPKPADAFAPFADDATAANIGALSFENGTTGIALHGSLELPKDRRGLARARKLRSIVEAIVQALEAAELPDIAERETSSPTKPVANPFTK